MTIKQKWNNYNSDFEDFGNVMQWLKIQPKNSKIKLPKPKKKSGSSLILIDSTVDRSVSSCSILTYQSNIAKLKSKFSSSSSSSKQVSGKGDLPKPKSQLFARTAPTKQSTTDKKNTNKTKPQKSISPPKVKPTQKVAVKSIVQRRINVVDSERCRSSLSRLTVHNPKKTTFHTSTVIDESAERCRSSCSIPAVQNTNNYGHRNQQRDYFMKKPVGGLPRGTSNNFFSFNGRRRQAVDVNLNSTDTNTDVDVTTTDDRTTVTVDNYQSANPGQPSTQTTTTTEFNFLKPRTTTSVKKTNSANLLKPPQVVKVSTESAKFNFLEPKVAAEDKNPEYEFNKTPGADESLRKNKPVFPGSGMNTNRISSNKHYSGYAGNPAMVKKPKRKRKAFFSGCGPGAVDPSIVSDPMNPPSMMSSRDGSLLGWSPPPSHTSDIAIISPIITTPRQKKIPSIHIRSQNEVLNTPDEAFTPYKLTLEDNQGMIRWKEAGIHVGLFLLPPRKCAAAWHAIEIWSKGNHLHEKVILRCTNVLTWHKTTLYRVFALISRGDNALEDLKTVLYKLIHHFKVVNQTAVFDFESTKDRERAMWYEKRKPEPQQTIFFKWIGEEGLAQLLKQETDFDIPLMVSEREPLYIYNGLVLHGEAPGHELEMSMASTTLCSNYTEEQAMRRRNISTMY